MEITFQPALDKNYSKASRALSRNAYKQNKFSKMIHAGDFLLYLFFLIPSIYIAYEMMNWEEEFYSYYENILAYYAGHILLAISVFAFLYAVLIRHYLYNLAFRSQVYSGIEKEKKTIRIQEDGLYVEIETCRTLYNYNYIHHIENKFGYLTIRINTGFFLLIPHSAFSDESQRLVFETALQEKVKTHQTVL
ncbi:YcxB family protein [Aggregatibacter kilianii]|uniref:YcxB family protein n=1 Tax=Aggregatibacter kilianii TaxID=2025884 RepID=UPI000D646127|nr:YcxB family protein [Aggregatibacter kilianii]